MKLRRKPQSPTGYNVLGPDPPLYLRISTYIFDDIPFTGFNVWCFTYPQSFTYWTASFLDINRASEIWDLILALFIKYDLHKGDVSLPQAQDLLRCNSKLSYYLAPFCLYEEYFDEWKERVKASEFLSNRERYINDVYPIHVIKANSLNSVEIRINLYTDFWFPWNMGLKRKEPATSINDMFDNRQGAWRHTPRLNQCLAEIRQRVLESGGSWEIGREHVHQQYQHMVRETGIELGMPDEVKYIKTGFNP